MQRVAGVVGAARMRRAKEQRYDSFCGLGQTLARASDASHAMLCKERPVSMHPVAGVFLSYALRVFFPPEKVIRVHGDMKVRMIKA